MAKFTPTLFSIDSPVRLASGKLEDKDLRVVGWKAIGPDVADVVHLVHVSPRPIGNDARAGLHGEGTTSEIEVAASELTDAGG